MAIVTPNANPTERFSLAESCRLTHVSRETYRHWQAVVPYLASRRGGAANLGCGDLLALAVMREVVKSLALAVGNYPLAFNQLFEALRSLPDPLGAAPGFALLTPQSVRLISGSSAHDWTSTEPLISVPLRPLVAEISAALALRGGTTEQPELEF